MKADIAEAKAVLNKEKKTAKAEAAKPGDGDAGAIPVAVAVIPVMTLMVGGDGYCNV